MKAAGLVQAKQIFFLNTEMTLKIRRKKTGISSLPIPETLSQYINMETV